jgi:hypothetical protein
LPTFTNSLIKMIIYYLFLLVILLLFGLINLIRRVKDDAVIYLQPSFSSVAAPRWFVLLVACAGLVAGIFFSPGMLGIARNGIFYPEVFTFSEIMVVFTAMIISDVILLNIFRETEFPVSSVIMFLFGLFGSSLAVSLVKIRAMRKSVGVLIQFINADKIIQILMAILISVIAAFILGAFIQYLVRFLFTFRYRKSLQIFGPFYGALMISMVLWIILIMGWEGSALSWLDDDKMKGIVWIKQHFRLSFGISIIGWTVLLWFIKRLFRTDVLKIVILMGTFVLALSVTANDMVNFAGVPLAGMQAFEAWVTSGVVTAEHFRMDFLNEFVIIPFFMLIAIGLIMSGVIVSRRKEFSNPEATLNPGWQNEADEHRLSVLLARSVTRNAIAFNRHLNNLFPRGLGQFIQKRFSYSSGETNNDQQVFTSDKIRISVNLFVSTALIALATSLKLPVSTIYVVFMVMLGTSLADKAWGRESAVFRISGIFYVMGSWSLAAIIAFTASAFFAWIIIVGGVYVCSALILIAAFFIIRTRIISRQHDKNTTEEEDTINEKDEIEESIDKCNEQIVKTIISTNQIFSFTLDSFLMEDRSHMHQTILLVNELNKTDYRQKSKIIQTIYSMKQLDVDSSYFYIQVMDYQREIVHSLNILIAQLNEHLENQLKPLTESQTGQVNMLVSEMDDFFNFALHIVKEEKFEAIDEWVALKTSLSERLSDVEKSHLIRIRNKEINFRNSQLFLKALTEIKNLLAHSVSMIKSYRDFVLVSRK